MMISFPLLDQWIFMISGIIFTEKRNWTSIFLWFYILAFISEWQRHILHWKREEGLFQLLSKPRTYQLIRDNLQSFLIKILSLWHANVICLEAVMTEYTINVRRGSQNTLFNYCLFKYYSLFFAIAKLNTYC